MEFGNLPPEILARIFKLLKFRERIRIERVCKEWRSLAWQWAWIDVRDLNFAHEDLCLLEPWKHTEIIEKKVGELDLLQSKVRRELIWEYRSVHDKCEIGENSNENLCEGCPKKLQTGKTQIRYTRNLEKTQREAIERYQQLLSTPQMYKKKRPSRSLGVLSALVRRCAPVLEMLRLEQGISIATRVGRYFRFLTPRLTHLSMEESIDEWHLQQIGEHLAPSLRSLGVSLNKRKRTLDAFISLMAKCSQLECLRINRLDNLFERARIKNVEGSEREYIVVLPKTLLFLCCKLVECKPGIFSELILNCPKLQFFLPIMQYFGEELEKEASSSEIYGIRWPFLYTSTSFLDLHPKLSTIRALKFDGVSLCGSNLAQIASNCPLLEHLDFSWVEYIDHFNYPVNVHDLEALFAFKRLSSLAIEFQAIDRYCPNESIPFHEMECARTDQMVDEVFLEILIKLNAIHPLRSLECRDLADFYFHSEYALKIIDKLSDLETFSCSLGNEKPEIFSKFAESIREIFVKREADGQLQRWASFCFRAGRYTRMPNFVVNWRKRLEMGEEHEIKNNNINNNNNNRRQQKQDFGIAPPFEVYNTTPRNPFEIYLGCSVVLREIMDETLGDERRTRILLGTLLDDY